MKRFLKNLLEKIICTVQEKGEVGNTVAFALLTAGIAPAFVIALTKSIREKKIAETLPGASVAAVRSIREIRQKCNNQEPELGDEEPVLDVYQSSRIKQAEAVAKRLTNFFNETSCSEIIVSTYDPYQNDGQFYIYEKTAAINGGKWLVRIYLNYKEMQTIEKYPNSIDNGYIYYAIAGPLNNAKDPEWGYSKSISSNFDFKTGNIILRLAPNGPGLGKLICNNAGLSLKGCYGVGPELGTPKIKKLIERATVRINNFLDNSFCGNVQAYFVFDVCGSDVCNEIAEECLGIAMYYNDDETVVKPKFGTTNYITGSEDFYSQIINAKDEELWKMIYEPFPQLWEQVKPEGYSDAVWNYSNKRLTLKAKNSYNFCPKPENFR